MAEELSSEQLEEITTHLKQNTTLDTKGCPVCGSNDMVIQKKLKSMNTASPDGNVDLEEGALYAEVHCNTCSATYLFNLFHMGLLP